MARKRAPLKLFSIVLVIILIFIVGKWLLFSPGKGAEEAVNEFYRYEQEGDFSRSWEFFHSEMKKKFSKGNYIQDRAHVFMNHFGVDTFTYTLGKPEKLDSWKMSKTGKGLKNVYKVPVTQTYKGKYGNFDLQQDVFAVEVKGEWKILWDYKH
ncbi:hypothetical protein [Neobacillus kokaensis]|uniref:DUF4878 domain-containing protein n=1 Tax=Neobacillus kokaensis TaxID=2759023 RepID=A0ABQ3N1G6_9BACI|nr:hypothetical protein [Neobacillus kokaensis]GHH97407.1 hypothetical protein AM1BK_09500 [Neobacillus kokaensis]